MKKNPIPLLAGLAALMAALGLYVSLQSPNLDPMTMEVRAEVLSCDDSEVRSSGYSHIGYQTLWVTILDSRFKGRQVTATNSLNGQVDLETLFVPGDEIIAALILDKAGQIDHVKAVDLYRQQSLAHLFILFTLALLIYAGIIGVKALILFVLSIFVIWEFLVRQILAGQPPWPPPPSPWWPCRPSSFSWWPDSTAKASPPLSAPLPA